MPVGTGISNLHACGRPSSGLQPQGIRISLYGRGSAPRNDGRLHSSPARTTTIPTRRRDSIRLPSPTWPPRKRPPPCFCRFSRGESVVWLRYHATQPVRPVVASFRYRGKLRYPSRFGASATTIFNIQQRPPPALARYWLSSATIRVVFGCRSLLVQENMGNDKKKPVWEKNSRGFWLAVCLVLSTLAGWVMFHLGLLH